MAGYVIWKKSTSTIMYLLHKSHKAPVPYPTMHHFVTEMCTRVTKWCIVGSINIHLSVTISMIMMMTVNYLPAKIAIWIATNHWLNLEYSRPLCQYNTCNNIWAPSCIMKTSKQVMLTMPQPVVLMSLTPNIYLSIYNYIKLSYKVKSDKNPHKNIHIYINVFMRVWVIFVFIWQLYIATVALWEISFTLVWKVLFCPCIYPRSLYACWINWLLKSNSKFYVKINHYRHHISLVTCNTSESVPNYKTSISLKSSHNIIWHNPLA